MKKVILFLLSCHFIAAINAQDISLKQKPAASDVKVINGEYTLHFKPSDLVAAISKIESVTKEDHSRLAGSIKENKIKSIDLNSTSADDKPFIDLVKSNLGCYLLSHGKVSVTKANKPLPKITAEEGPPVVDLEGTSWVDIYYSDGEQPVFLGKLHTKLKD